MPSAYERPAPRTFASCGGGTATPTPTRADATPLAGRSSVTMINEDTVNTLRVSPDSAMSTTPGNAKVAVPVAPGASVTLYWSDKVPVYVAGATVNYVMLEEG